MTGTPNLSRSDGVRPREAKLTNFICRSTEECSGWPGLSPPTLTHSLALKHDLLWYIIFVFVYIFYCAISLAFGLFVFNFLRMRCSINSTT